MVWALLYSFFVGYRAKWLPVLLFLQFLLCGALRAQEPKYSIWDHGKDCARELGVEVPRFNCLDGAEIPVTRNGVRVRPGDPAGPCDRPADGSSACIPGSRLLRFVDTIVRAEFERERIVTTIICRGGGSRPGDPDFHDVAIIQHNELNNKVCWFNQLGNQNSTNVPPPYQAGVARDRNQEAEKYWGKTPTTLNCMSCHDNGLYLRTPWIMQVDSIKDGSFIRNAGKGQYEKGGLNGFPLNSRAGKQGFACTVGKEHFVEWNKTLPKLVKINANAFDARLNEKGRSRTDNTASPDTCTQCHYLGIGGISCSLGLDALGLNGRGRTERLHDFAKTFPNSRWMPPEAKWPPNVRDLAKTATDRERQAAQRGFDTYYAPAIEALRFCCDQANYDSKAVVAGRRVKICQGTFLRYPQAQDPCAGPGAGDPPDIRHRPH